jgi:methylmalonyl-CoA/ethylmalonyl-CoA epimerase
VTTPDLPSGLAGLPLDHVAIAVEDLDAASRSWTLLGAVPAGEDERVDAQGVLVRTLRLGATLLELLEPIDQASPVGRFLARRGAGLHHLALRVHDVEATLRGLLDEGAVAIDAAPRPGRAGTRVAFLHPRWTGGVLVELVEHVCAGAADDAGRGW